MRTKRSTTFRLSEECRQLLTLLRRSLGVTKTGIVEMSVRALAKKEGVNERREA